MLSCNWKKFSFFYSWHHHHHQFSKFRLNGQFVFLTISRNVANVHKLPISYSDFRNTYTLLNKLQFKVDKFERNNNKYVVTTLFDMLKIEHNQIHGIVYYIVCKARNEYLKNMRTVPSLNRGLFLSTRHSIEHCNRISSRNIEVFIFDSNFFYSLTSTNEIRFERKINIKILNSSVSAFPSVVILNEDGC